jgi:hypothetical protein
VRLSLALIAVLAAGCASQPAPRITPERHAANVAAAQSGGFKIITKGDRSIFCPGAAATGTHMAPTCMTEAEFESLLGPPHSMTPAAHVTNQSPGPGPGAGH